MVDVDLKALMRHFLGMEMDAVREVLGDYCTAIVVLISPDRRWAEQVSFVGEDEKIARYKEVVQRARAAGATVIVTINAARTGKATSPHDLDGYWWGKLEAENARDCISITASGPGMASIGLDLGYDIVDGQVYFDPAPEFSETEIGMLPGWPGGSPSPVH